MALQVKLQLAVLASHMGSVLILATPHVTQLPANGLRKADDSSVGVPIIHVGTPWPSLDLLDKNEPSG